MLRNGDSRRYDGTHHLSPADLARRQQVSPHTIYRWRRTGTGPPYMRIGRHVRYRMADVTAWEDARRIARWAS